jgi:acetyltransferase-like isoleucine patch superfamily enzyme
MYYTSSELLDLGFSHVGDNCKISNKTSLYSVSGRIGHNVRVDDFCVLKGHIILGSFIHIGSFSLLSSPLSTITLEDFSTLSSGVHIYSASDKYSSNALSSSSVPFDMTDTIIGPVVLRKCCLVGAHSLILPNTKIGVGSSIGAHCIIRHTIPDGSIIVSSSRNIQHLGFRDHELILSLANRIYDSGSYQT